MKHTVLFAAALWFMFHGFSVPAPLEAADTRLPPLPSEAPSPFVQFLHGIRDIPRQQNVVITDQRTLERWWDTKRGDPPKIDFAKHVVLLATLGAVPSDEYRAIAVESMEKPAGGGVKVNVVETRTQGPKVQELRSVYPFCAVVIEKPDGPITWSSLEKRQILIRSEVRGFDRYPNEATAVIRSEAAARHYWAGNPGPMPKINFGRLMLLAGFRGECPTTGYEVQVTGLRIEDGELVVSVSTATPAKEAPMAPIRNNPSHVLAVDGWDGPVRFAVTRTGRKPEDDDRKPPDSVPPVFR